MKNLFKWMMACILFCCASTVFAQLSCVDSFTYHISGDTVSFTNLSHASINHTTYSWHWTFGDGSAAQDSNTVHVYSQPGTYTVCLIMTSYYSTQPYCQDTFCQTVTVTHCNGFNANWGWNAGANGMVYFNAQDTNSSNNHYWNYGDGTTGSGVATTHAYNAPGTYHVCLYVYHPGVTCVDSFCNNISVTSSNVCANTVASFTYTITHGTMVLHSTTTGLSGTPFYQWWMDGQVVGTLSPSTSTFTMAQVPAGVHNFCLYVYGNQSTFCDSACQSICVAPNAEWTYTVSGDTMRFVSADTGSGNSHYWSFGDGTSGVNTTSGGHVFSGPGTYHVCLFVYKPAYSCVDSMCQNITIAATTACANTIANFTYTVTHGVVVLHSTSTGLSGTPYYQWWMDGQIVGTLNPSAASFTMSHVAPGVHTFCLYVYGNQSTFCDSACQSICVAPSAEWTYTLSGDTLRAASADTSSANHHFWVVDGVYNTQNFTHLTQVFASGGTHHVCLVVYTPGISCTDSLCNDIVITTNPCPGLTAAWTYTYVNNSTIHFVAADTNSADHHDWNFGDGVYSFDVSPTHTYNSSGLFHVCLYAYTNGCVDSFCANVQANGATSCGNAVADFHTTVSGNTVSLTNASTGTSPSTLYQWWIDGNAVSSPGANTSYTVSNLAAGAHTFCLYIYASNNTFCDSACHTIVIAPCTAPSADWTYTISGDTLRVTAHDTASADHRYWSFDGTYNTTNAINLTQIYPSGGTHHICLIVYTPGVNCVDSLCRDITIQLPCSNVSAAWTSVYSNTSASEVHFFAADTISSQHHIWSFGDGTTSAVVNPVHNYTSPGVYHVCLYVYIPGSICSDSSCADIIVTGTSSSCANTVASFTHTVSGTALVLTSTSTGVSNTTLYEWFIDGQIVSGLSTNHAYTATGLTTGTHVACLYVFANQNTFCDSACQTIVITACSPPSAYWSYGINGDTVHFETQDTVHTNNHYWSFGDGTTGANSTNLSHVFAHAGTYHVCLYVYTPGTNCGVDSFCRDITIGSTNCGTASFTYTISGTNVVAVSNSVISSNITQYQWYVWTSNGTLVEHVTGGSTFTSYSLNSGTYTVCLYLYNGTAFCDSACQTVVIAGGNPCSTLNAGFTTTYQNNGGIHFIGAANTNTVYNIWNFGDGTSATTFDPTHYYAHAGVYTVCHIVGISGTTCADTSCQYVQSSGTTSACHANFTWQIVQGSALVYFHSTSTTGSAADSIVSYTYNFGDGVLSHDPNVSHTYNHSGTYIACLEITTASGCSSTVCDTVVTGVITGTCNASFTYTFDSCNIIHFNNTSTGGYVSWVWNFGDGSTSTALNPTHTFGAGAWTVTLTIGNSSISCYNTHSEVINVQPCNVTPGDTVCGTVFNDANGNGVQDNNEQGIPGAEVHVGSYVTVADAHGHYMVVVPPGTYYIYYCAPAGYTFTIPVTSSATNNCAVYQVNITHSHCGFDFGIQTSSSTICGTVYYDGNNNHVFDPNAENGVPNVAVYLTDGNGHSYTVYTDQYGHYCAVVAAGTYTITVVTSTASGTITPQHITITVVNGHTYGDNNFGIYSQPGSCDMRISLTPQTNVVPGFPVWYQVEICNAGTNTTHGTVNLFYNPGITFNYASPQQTSQNASTHTVSWNFTGITPGNCEHYFVSLTADSTLTMGQFIFTLANVTTDGCTDVNSTNNVDTLHQNVEASWDPNNKFVYPTGEGPNGAIYGTEELSYTVNFQNTGTTSAVNVVVHDTISNNLDLSTFKMLGASHPYTMQFNGRVAIWKFNAIMLPDSGTDMQGSHGFVNYAIKPVQGLAQGTQITNTADIYFDYNSGVSTNTTLNTIDYKLSVDELNPIDATITLQPNPFSQLTTIKIEGADAPFELRVYDMVGRLARLQTADNNMFTIQRGALAAGVYMYEVVKEGKVIGKGKMIAE